MEYYFCTLSIFVFGLFVIYLGIMVRLGKLKRLFLGGSFPVLAQRDIFLIAVPIGLALVSVGFMIVLPTWREIFGFLMLIFNLIAIILGIWRPDWIKPTWLRWLEDKYAHVRDEMLYEANQMGVKQWVKVTNTEEGLERWADSVAEKHGWQRLGERQ